MEDPDRTALRAAVGPEARKLANRALRQLDRISGYLNRAIEDPRAEHEPEEDRLAAAVEADRAAAAQALADRVAAAKAAGDQVALDQAIAEQAAAIRQQRAEPFVKMIGQKDRVKTAESLAGKYRDEGARHGVPLNDFLANANDLIRFSMQVPEDHYSGELVVDVLRRLGRLGFTTVGRRPLEDAVDAKNFWRPGNRFYGLNITIREPVEGRLMELQFPTQRSWDTGKLTHPYFEVVRRSEKDFATRVDSFLQILRINKAAGLPTEVPENMDGLPTAKFKGFAEWVGDETAEDPEKWQLYIEHLAREHTTFRAVVEAHGLTPDDLPRAEEKGLFRPATDVRPLPDGGTHADGTHGTAGRSEAGHSEAGEPDDDLGRMFRRGPGELEPFGEYRDGLDFRTSGSPLREAMPSNPNEAFARLHEQVEHLRDAQLSRSESLRGDPKRWFAQVYANVTHFELQMIDHGRYTYPIMKLQEVVAFERTFDLNIGHWRSGHLDEVEPNWRLAFGAIDRAPEQWHPLGSFEVLDSLLPAMVAHIEFDLPRALAAVFEEYYQASGLPFDTFKPDFDAMRKVFELANTAMMPDIADVTRVIDPGRYELVHRYGFPFIYDINKARAEAWHTADLIISGHELGIHDQAGMEHRVMAGRVSRNPLSGNGGMRIAGERVRGYDFNRQPMDTLRHPPAPTDGRPGIVGPDGKITTTDAQIAVIDSVGLHRPELAAVVEKLLDDPHGLNVTAALRTGSLHDHVLSVIEELARGDALRPYDGDLAAFVAAHPGQGPLFDHVPPEFNRVTGPDGIERTRMSVFVDESKASDSTMRIGPQPSPEEMVALQEHADRLRDLVQPAVHREVESIAEVLRGHTTGPVAVNSRPKDADGLIDKVVRFTRGSEHSPPRPGYRVGDVIDAIGARLTVPDMRTLERAYAAVMDHYGVGDGGRILEIDNMYADPKSKNPIYRVIPMTITIDIGGHRYPFELQLTSLRASVAADIEHNSVYKRYVDISPDEEDAVMEAFSEAAALDQLESRDD